MDTDIRKGFIESYNNDNKYKALIKAILRSKPSTKDGKDVFSR